MEWSKEEITALKKAIKKTSAVEDKNQRWKDIANLVGNGKTKKYCYLNLEFPIKSEHYGLVQFVISVLLTKGVDTIKGEMDQLMGGQLIGAHDYCTQDIVNLLLCGYACSNVFNGEQVLEGGSSEDTIVLRGVSSQSTVGFLSLFEAYQNLVPFGMEPALLRLHLVLTAMAVGYGVIFLLCVWIVVYMRHHRSDFAYLKLQRKIGAGASAVVFQGVLHSKIPVAIKVYTPRMLSEETVAEFSHEAALCDYMAPELIEGKAGTAVYGEAADIYSLAITLWDIVNPLGSKYPEANRSHLQVFDSVLVGERPPLSPSMHPELRRLLTEAWHQQPERRPSATYILTALETLQQEVGAHTALGLASAVERTDDSCIVSGQLLIQHMLKLNFVDSMAEACRSPGKVKEPAETGNGFTCCCTLLLATSN
ncbi:hypothetical protein JM18_000483 [Phytophthora kernoviae]|uniref:Protein kinase domain-containing protein n=2 Tax=Phytophthora kernoviae TaxID=325452 RepID=A0A8T0M525_9STRA|nr:hypothetical protein G195_002804 [Phytophthora kernoviae 00238/432]KAG2528382.1 hypothetical protein JM16_002940 [Phytophthora kernoviae]KAG2532594.1 hypothetical protein JM18_000483 [Phytophthora kernoviae]